MNAAKPHVEMIFGKDHKELQSKVNKFLSNNFISGKKEFNHLGQKQLIDIKYNFIKEGLSAMIIYEKYS